MLIFTDTKSEASKFSSHTYA